MFHKEQHYFSHTFLIKYHNKNKIEIIIKQTKIKFLIKNPLHAVVESVCLSVYRYIYTKNYVINIES